MYTIGWEADIMLFYNHFSGQGRLNSSGNLQMQRGEVKDETSFWHNTTGIWTRVLQICFKPRYQ